MSLIRSVAHNTFYQLLSKVASTILGLIALAVMARYLGVEQFGWYTTAVGFLQFVGVLTDFGFVVTTSALLSEPRFDKSRLLNTIFTWRLLTALATQGLAVILIFLFPYPPAIKWAATVMAISFLGVALNQVFIGYYQANLKMAAPSVGEVLSRVVLLLGTVMVAKGNAGFLPMMGAITIASLTYTFYLWLKCAPIKLTLDKDIGAALFKRLWPTALAVLFNAFYLLGDRVILPLYASQTDVGLYGAAYRAVDIITQITAVIMGITMPLMAYAHARGLYDEFKIRLQLSFDLMALIVVPAIAGILALSTPIMIFVAGAGFESAGPILTVLILSLIGILPGMTFGHAALAMDKQKQTLWIYGSSAVLSVAAYFYFIPLYGVWGAAGVSVASQFYAGALLMIVGARFARYFPRPGALIKIIAAAVIMAVSLRYLPNYHVLALIAAGAVIYAGLILTLGAVKIATIRQVLAKNQVATPPERW